MPASRGLRVRWVCDSRNHERPDPQRRNCRERDPAHSREDGDCRRVSAEPDGGGRASLVDSNELGRALRARARHAGQSPQRAPVQHALEGASKPNGRIRESASRDLALLGARRALGLPGRALSVLAHDAGIHAPKVESADGAGLSRRGSAEDDRVGCRHRRRASAPFLLHPEVPARSHSGRRSNAAWRRAGVREASSKCAAAASS